MWLYKHKYNADGSLNRYKARLVANGRSQQQGIDCDETFSPVVKPTTIWTGLSLTVSRQWPIHQLDVKNAFLYGHLIETLYMHRPPRFIDSAHFDYVCLLQNKTDSSLFIFHKGPDTAYLLLYVDDIILTTSSTSLLQRIISLLHAEFATIDIGPLNYFLGCLATRQSTSGYYFFLGDNLPTWSFKRQDTLSCSSAEVEYCEVANAIAETSWIRNLLRELHTLLFTATLSRPSELGFNDFLSMLFEPVSITSKQTRLFSSFTRDQTQLTYYYMWMISFAQLLLLHSCNKKYANEILEKAQMLNCNPCRIPIDTEKKLGPEGSPVTDPTYIAALQDHFRTTDLGLQLFWSTTSQLIAYSDLTGRFAEVEYCEVVNAIAETSWIRNLLRELHTLLFTATFVYCDNVCAVYMYANPEQHQCTKHIEIDIHFVHDKVVAGHVQVRHVLSRFLYAYFFTKGLSYPLFADFRSILSVCKSSAPTAGAY
nr:ribonuclease H-like domain-containing protein [Tanacetum cinerariifolium]